MEVDDSIQAKVENELQLQRSDWLKCPQSAQRHFSALSSRKVGVSIGVYSRGRDMSYCAWTKEHELRSEPQRYSVSPKLRVPYPRAEFVVFGQENHEVLGVAARTILMPENFRLQ
jgi:hypothetical protein